MDTTHGHVFAFGIEVIPVASDVLPIGHCGSVGAEVVPNSFMLVMPLVFNHVGIKVAVISVLAKDEAGLHIAILIKVICAGRAVYSVVAMCNRFAVVDGVETDDEVTVFCSPNAAFNAIMSKNAAHLIFAVRTVPSGI